MFNLYYIFIHILLNSKQQFMTLDLHNLSLAIKPTNKVFANLINKKNLTNNNNNNILLL